MKNSSLHSFVRNIYGFAFFNALLLLSPIYAIFMQEHGVSDMQLSVIFIAYSVGAFVFQIPATWATNKFGQKRIIITGQILKMMAFTLWVIFPNFWGFVLGMILWGIQSAGYNVALESMMYDELHARKHHNMYAKILGRRKTISNVGAALSAVGSLLLFFGYGAITAVSVLSVFISMIFISRIKIISKHALRKKSKQSGTDFLKVFRAGVGIIRRTPCIFYMMLICVMVGNFSYLGDHYSVIGVDVGIRKEFIGILPFFITLCQMCGQFFAHRYQKMPDWKLYSLIALGGAVYVAFAIWYTLPALVLLGFGALLFAGINVLVYSRFQDFVPTVYRPVALSMISLMDQTMYVGLMLVIGVGASIGGWRIGVLLLGMILIAIALWALVFVRDKCAIGQNPNLRVVKTRDSPSAVSPSKF